MAEEVSNQTFNEIGRIKVNTHIVERLKNVSRFASMPIFNMVEGDYAEFGVARGTSAQVIAATLNTHAGTQRRHFHLFDSFRGLPVSRATADVESPAVKSGVWAPGRCDLPGVVAITTQLSHLYPQDLLRLYDGWFEETVPLIEHDQKFAFVHLDCDLYSSTLIVLKHLFAGHHLNDGCLLLLDDFLCNRGSKEFGMRKAWIDCVGEFSLEVTDLGLVGTSSWAFIYHQSSASAR